MYKVFTLAAGTNINITQGGTASRSGLIISDSNNNADALGGNPMPGGTTISFSVDGSGVSIVGNSSYTVDTLASAPTGAYAVSLRADPVVAPATVATGVCLLLTIDPPDEDPTEFSWPITVLP